MNNLKKLGLSALAGSLVAFSANAGELSVSGSAEFTYTDNDGTSGSGNEITGNPFGAQQLVVFTGSGDVGFGELTVVRSIADAGGSNPTSYATLDMGSLGTLSFDSNGYGGVGYAANDDILPTAYEEIWTGSSDTSGISGAGSNNTLGYANSFGPLSFSIGYQKNGASANQSESKTSGAGVTGSTTDMYVSAAVPGVDGLTVGFGHAEITQNTTETTDADSTSTGMNINYSAGPVAVGYRIAEYNDGTAVTGSQEIDAWSVAFNVNENMAISYGKQDRERQAVAAAEVAVTEEVTGINASYTVGAASIRILNSKAKNSEFSANENEHTEIGVVLSF